MTHTCGLELTAGHTFHIIFTASLIQMSRSRARIGAKSKHRARRNIVQALCDLVLICGNEFQLQITTVDIHLNGSTCNAAGIDGKPAPAGGRRIIGLSVFLAELIPTRCGLFCGAKIVQNFRSADRIDGHRTSGDSLCIARARFDEMNDLFFTAAAAANAICVVVTQCSTVCCITAGAFLGLGAGGCRIIVTQRAAGGSTAGGAGLGGSAGCVGIAVTQSSTLRHLTNGAGLGSGASSIGEGVGQRLALGGLTDLA